LYEADETVRALLTKTSPFQVMFGRNCFLNEEESEMDKHVSDDVDMEDW
jgi:hypothetical protein